jgi:hypothetical protein
MRLSGTPITLWAASAASGQSTFGPGNYSKQILAIIPFVVMLQEMTVEYGDAANDRVREIHDEIE